MPSLRGAGRRNLPRQAVVWAAIVLLAVATAWVFHNRSGKGYPPSWDVPANAAGRFLSRNHRPSIPGSGDLVGRMATKGLSLEELWAGLANHRLPWSERAVFLNALAVAGGTNSAIRMVAAFLVEAPDNQGAFARILSRAGWTVFARALEALLEDGDDAHAAAAIRGLAGIGGDAGLQLLADIMDDDAWPEALRREAACGLLQCANPDVVAFGIRGLANIGDEGSRAALAGILHNGTKAQSLRLKAATALGRIGSQSAADDLILAFNEFPEEDTHRHLLDALGHCPFPVIENTFRDYLADPEVPAELRSAAAEALSNSTGESLPMLQNLAATDADPEVREMAAWAISTREPGGQLGSELARMLVVEPEPDVRRRLYEGLLVQAENPADSLLPLIESEDDPAARVAAFNSAGDAVGRGSSAALAARFDSQMVPELEAVALGESSLNLRMRAVFALRRADTLPARNALSRISTTPTPEIATAAANGLHASR